MKPDHWRSHKSGDFSDPNRWKDGVPDAHTAAVIDATGGSYTVRVTDVEKAASLLVDSADASLVESGGGILHISGALGIEAGLVRLDGTSNSFGGGVDLSGGVLQLTSSGALGGADVRISGAGEILGGSNVTFLSHMQVTGSATLAAEAGDVFTFKGVASFADAATDTLAFTGGGEIDWQASGMAGYSGDVSISGGTTVAIADPGALGAGTIDLDNATLAFTEATPGGPPGGSPFTADVSVHEDVDVDVIEAILVMAGALSVDSDGHMVFSPDVRHPGAPVAPVVDLELSGFSAAGSYFLAATGVTVECLDAGNAAFASMWSGATTVTLGKGAVLDLGGQDAITLNGLSGTGAVVDTGAGHLALTLSTAPFGETGFPAFGGDFSGDMTITVNGLGFLQGSHFDLAKGDSLNFGHDFQLINLDGAKIAKGSQLVIDMHGAGFQNPALEIDPQFAARIAGFSGGAELVFVSLDYDAAHTTITWTQQNAKGGLLEIQIGDQEEIRLHMLGDYEQSNFRVAQVTNGHVGVFFMATPDADLAGHQADFVV